MDLAAILARKIALSLPAWQCAQAKNEEQAGASIDRPRGNAADIIEGGNE
jgi:hypothetical protein